MTDTKTRPDRCWSRLPVYRPGGRLTAEQLNTSQEDTLRRERLLNLALHGVGVVFGFDIETDGRGRIRVEKCRIRLGCGLALDRWGRMLYWGGGWIGVEELIGCAPERPGCYTLRVHYAEKAEAPAWDPCQEDTGWIDRCVALTLAPGCTPFDPCPTDLPDDPCATRRDYTCARTGQHGGKAHAAADLARACETPPPLDTSDCGRLRYDPEAGLPLACVEICDVNRGRDDCRPKLAFCPCPPDNNKDDRDAARDADRDAGRDAACDDCGCDRHGPCAMRPVAYRAPLLHELINDTDVQLVRVRAYSWSAYALGPWDTQMPFSEFAARVNACRGIGDGDVAIYGDDGPTSGFKLWFTGPLDPATLHPLSVLMDVYIRESNYDETYGRERVVNWKHHRVPIIVDPILGDDTSCALGVRLCPSDSWFKYIRQQILRCANADQLARVEITLRGQVIWDKCGCMLDARPVELTCRDHCGHKTGQARPGDDWLSLIRIGPDLRDDRRAEPEDRPAEQQHPSNDAPHNQRDGEAR